jgi:hypothetical protein
MQKNETWTHHCSHIGKYLLLEYSETCQYCRINSTVHSLRHSGYLVTAKSESSFIERSKNKIAALFQPPTKHKTLDDEYKVEFYDRLG